MLTRRSALLASAALPASLAFAPQAKAQQPSTLRIAMTLADIPVTDGAPDQGTEGIRFMGYTMYDPLVMWDLLLGDRARQAGAGAGDQVDPGPSRPNENGSSSFAKV
jgi:hypothetical protein